MNFLDYDKSIELLLKDIQPLKIIELFIRDAQGYVLAKDIIANSSSPEHPTSAMDGYAIKHEDLKLKKLKITATNPAGSDISEVVNNKECIKTFTGSLMPKGADTLIPIEFVSVEGDYIIINKEISKGANVRDIGENYKKGDRLLKKGDMIDYIHIGILASLNISHVEVYQKPIIATLSTGSEILDIGEKQTNKAQIRSTNHLVMEAIAKKHGGFVNQFGVVKDDKETILKTFKKALASSDIVVSSGGVSVGDYDFVKDIIKDELKAEIIFKGVAIKPGKHIMVAKKDNKFIIGLPGFAYSSTVTFLFYIVPLIYAMQNTENKIQKVQAKLKEDFHKRSKFTEFTACNLKYENGSYYVDFEGKKIGTSAILTNMLNDSALMITYPSDGDKKKEEIVEVLKI